MARRTNKGKTAPHSWKPGDSARLKTGKLRMTVFKVRGEMVTCHLEVGNTIKEKTFHSAQLMHVVEEMSDEELEKSVLSQLAEITLLTMASLSDAELHSRKEMFNRLRDQFTREVERRSRKKRPE
jgi:uncharacterized protein YodC (DUF2158 family)